MKQKVMRVAVIGAGAAGLCALRHLAFKQSTKNPKICFRAVAYEQAPRIGGTWIYTEKTGTDEWGQPVHSSMYKNLRTNLPKECMGFPDFPFPIGPPSFIGHLEVVKYLEDYASNFDLWNHIKLQRHVKHVKPVHNDQESHFGVKWEVTTIDVKTKSDEETDIFDAVLFCPGNYSKPYFPNILGLERYQGNLIHSHDYKEPSSYKNQTVVVLGAAASGQDITVEVSSVAKQVYLCHNKARLMTYLPKNVEQKPGVKHCHSRVLEFHDGSALEVDSMILCTGYLHEFDPLSKEVELRIEDHRITPLYQHLLHCRYPNLGFVGIPKIILPMPLFDIQIRFFRAVLEGSCTLPSEQEMIDDAESDYQLRRNQGLPHRYAHILADRQFAYNNNLARMASIEPLPAIHEKIYMACHVIRRANVVNYRRHNFVLLGNGNFKLVEEDLKVNGS